MRLIDADHLISILKEYIKREDSYISICNNPTLAKGIRRGLQEAVRTVKKEPSAQPEILACGEGELNVPDTNVGDTISRQAAIDALGDEPEVWTEKDEYAMGLNNQWHSDRDAIKALPPAQPEYEPVKAEDFAKTMSENTLYGFMAWHGEALELMERQGFVICKKRREE